jgi:magnesium transporter
MHYVNVTLAQHVNNRNVAGVQHWLADRHPHEIADEIARSDEITAILLFRSLDKDRAIEVFEALSVDDQHNILSSLRGHAFRELVEAIGPNDRARLLREVPATVAQRVLAGLSVRERMMTAALLGYPERSAGRIMSPEIVLLRQDMTATDALATIRLKGEGAETVYTLPVADDARHLMGVVNLKDLVLASPNATVASIASTDSPRVKATDDAETAARLMQDANLIDLPVVDSENRVVGLLTIDDAVSTIEAADTEDIARQSAAEPLTGHYMGARVSQIARARVVWLLLLIVAATLTVSVLDSFEGQLASLTQLAVFVPLLVGTGGNVGAQAATTVVRALAIGEVRTTDFLKVAWRECRVGLLLGAVLSAFAFAIGALWGGRFDLALTVALAVIAICVWAAVVGASMPLLAKRFGIDPAVISAPLVTTFVDATGLIIYFSIAIAVIPGL